VSNTAKNKHPRWTNGRIWLGRCGDGYEYAVDPRSGNRARLSICDAEAIACHTYTGEKLIHVCEQLLRAASVALAGADQDAVTCFDDAGEECDIEIGVGDTVLVHVFNGKTGVTHQYKPGAVAGIVSAMLGGE